MSYSWTVTSPRFGVHSNQELLCHIAVSCPPFADHTIRQATKYITPYPLSMPILFWASIKQRRPFVPLYPAVSRDISRGVGMCYRTCIASRYNATVPWSWWKRGSAEAYGLKISSCFAPPSTVGLANYQEPMSGSDSAGPTYYNRSVTLLLVQHFPVTTKSLDCMLCDAHSLRHNAFVYLSSYIRQLWIDG